MRIIFFKKNYPMGYSSNDVLSVEIKKKANPMMTSFS